MIIVMCVYCQAVMYIPRFELQVDEKLRFTDKTYVAKCKTTRGFPKPATLSLQMALNQ